MVREILAFFEPLTLSRFVDCTLGYGGHAEAILLAHPELKRLIALDQDPLAQELSKERLLPFKEKIAFVLGNFRHLEQFIGEPVEGIFMDIGVSSMQLDRAERGFSFSKEGPLDMRMDPSLPLSAADVVNRFPERTLAEIFRDLGEEPRARQAAGAIVQGRKKRQIETTSDLAALLADVLPRRRGKNIHPLTLVFQALRIFVNDELGALQEALPKAVDLLATGGRLGVLTFHSLEDRIVKQAFRTFGAENRVKLLTKKPQVPSVEEMRRNPRSRSAKLRFLEKL